MSLKFKYTPLSFLKNDYQVKEQIRNTVILKYFFDLNRKTTDLQKLIEGTQYGYNASALESGANKFLRISDITDGKVDWGKVPFCDCKDESTYLLENEDLLIARTGGTTGKSFLINSPPNKAIYAGYLIRIRANQNSLPEFLNLFLNSYAYWSQVLSLNKGEFRPSVNATKLKKLQLPDCSMEQQRDAIKLSKGESVNGYKDLTERIELALNQFQKGKNLESLFQTQKSLLTQLKQSILQEAIQGKLTHEWREKNSELITGENSAASLLKNIKAEKAQLVKEKKIKKEKPLPPITEDEIPFELPEGWVWCRLGEIIRVSSGDGLTSKEMIEGKIPVFGGNGINGYHNKSNTLEETITIGRVGAYCGAVHLTPRKAWITDNCFRVYYGKSYLYEAYLVWHLQFLNLGQASYEGSQPVISGKRIYPLLTFLPPLEEQKAIVEKVEALMKISASLEKQITQSEQHSQMLMQAVLKEAFEGEEKNEIKSEVEIV